MVHIKFPGEVSSDKFISVVILSYKRPDLTLNLINSLHQHADMPFELIVHDDSSPSADRDQLYQHVDKMSSLIVTGGELNMGLAASFERGVSLASSDYILCLNNDALLVGPGLNKVPKVLRAPYVGVYGPWQVHDGPQPNSVNKVLVANEGLRFHLGTLNGSGSIMAFRRDLWEEVGGWPHVMTGSSDTAFQRKVMKAGYFNASNLDATEETFDNVDFPRCERSTIGLNRYDASYPWIFNVDRGIISKTGSCRQHVEHFTRTDQEKPAGINNNDWWFHYMQGNVLPEVNNFNWEALTYHQRFKEQVEKDLV